MKINQTHSDGVRETIRKEEVKKEQAAVQKENKKADGVFVVNEARPQNLKNYSITREESESLLNSVRKSLSEMGLGVEEIVLNLKHDSVFSILKESN